ncbi:MAG: flagellar protein FlgN [Bacteroidota bacterium]
MSIPRHDAAPEPLAEALVRTLETERSILKELDDDFQLQREAIARRDFAAIEEATHRTNDHVARLDTLRKTRQRQTKLLARVLGIPGEDIRVAQITELLGGHLPICRRLENLRDEIRAVADGAQDKIDEVAFLLQHSIDLGRDMMQAVHGVEMHAPAHAYTSAGRSPAATPANLVNRVG